MGGVIMRKSRFIESHIVSIPRENESGQQVTDICRDHGISTSCFYQWKSKYGELESSDLMRLEELESENNRLKKMYADMALENRAIKDVLGKL
jgi:putative transposase